MYLDVDDDSDLPPDDVCERIDSGDLFFADAGAAAVFGDAVSTGRQKLPWRYRWPDEIFDEALARLLALNADRVERKRLTGLTANTTRSRKKRKPASTIALFD